MQTTFTLNSHNIIGLKIIMRSTFALLIEQSIQNDDLSSLEGTVALKLLQGEFAEVFQSRKDLPIDNDIHAQYQLLTQYITKLVLVKEAPEKNYSELTNTNTIKAAFKNAPLDEVTQVLDLLRRMDAPAEIRQEILATVCEAPYFYQKESGKFLFPADIPKQMQSFYAHIEGDQQLVDQFNTGVQKTVEAIAEDYSSRQALVKGILAIWENTQNNLTTEHIQWLKTITFNLQTQYTLVPSVLSEIFSYCKNAGNQLVQNPWTTAGFSGLVGFLFIPQFMMMIMSSNKRLGFIESLQNVMKKPRPFTERESKALEPYINKLFTMAKVFNIDINQLEQEAEETREWQSYNYATPAIFFSTLAIMAIIFLGQFKNVPAPIPLPEWVNPLEASLSSIDNTTRSGYNS